ncbi:MAG TPA: D-alanine--D-alanine ligase family protein [Candidatus Absconditabacterales bacterium]|nr:D-alanine--D-alanine ligase family protein [Candidatus Absconditabacterales bacterium]
MNVLLLCGGPGVEHEVSLMSAKNIVQAIDKDKYQIDILYITKEKLRYRIDENQLLANDFNTDKVFSVNLSDPISYGLEKKYDALFPIIHGTRGEDGVIQSLGKILDIPVVGCDILSSAICMDKDVAKRLLRDANLPIVPFVSITKDIIPPFHQVEKKLGVPFFIKPAQSGSSVGVSKVTTPEDYENALNEAFLYDKKVLIEKNIQGVELECAVLGVTDLIVSLPGKIINHTEFYSYHAKYFDGQSVTFELPAHIQQEVKDQIQELSRKVFITLGCSGMARIDFFLSNQGELFINEINTIPGFTNISMYPKLLELMGLSYREILTKLIISAGK